MRGRVLAVAVVGMAILTSALPAVAVIDHKAPVIKGASLSRERIDVTLQDRKLTARVRITDNTGVEYVQIYLVRPDDNWAYLLANPADRVSGTRRDGVYEARTTIPRYSEAGEFRLWVDVNDSYGNSASRIYDGVTVRVIDRDEDTAPPRLRVLQPANDSRYNVRRHAVVVPVRLRSLDDKSGVDGLDICLRWTVKSSYQPQHCDRARKVRGNARDAVWEVRLRLPKNSPGGVWNVEATVTDRAHPEGLDYWMGPDLFEQHEEQAPDSAFKEYFPFPKGKGRIRVRGFRDVNPPQITRAAVTPTQLVAGVGGKVVLKVWARDVEGVLGIYGWAGSAETGQEAGIAEMRLVRGTRKDGVWKGSFVASASLNPGTYDVGFNVWDRTHYVYYRGDDGVEGAIPVPGQDHFVIKPAS